MKLATECMKSQQCAPLKHHYDECAERVTQQHEEHGKAHEDCVEECKLHHPSLTKGSKTPTGRNALLTQVLSLPPHALRH